VENGRPSAALPRCGEPPPSGDYGPVTCREWAEAAAREAGDLLPEVIAEGLELPADGCEVEVRGEPPVR
jgi:hypothetical protein